MSLSLQRLKTEFARNRGKSLTLAGLTLVMVLFGVKAVFDMQPKSAAASAPTDSASLPVTADAAAAPEAGRSRDLEDRVKKSAALWSVLRQKKGLEANLAFHFSPEGYSLDPNRRVVIVEATSTQPAKTVQISTTIPPEELARLNREKLQIEAQRLLVLRAILLGNEPSALVDIAGKTELKHVGDVVVGFKIRLIQEQQITVEKDGELVAVSMPKSQMPK